MLGTFSYEVSRVVHQLGDADQVSIKLADAESVGDLQYSVAEGSNIIYDVMEKKASEVTPGDLPQHRRMTLLVEKMAHDLGVPQVGADTLHKLAAVVEADRALSATLDAEEMSDADRVKLSSLRMFGREYFMELLRGVV